MVETGQLGRATPATHDLKGRIAAFMRAASTEITPSEEDRLPELAAVLAKGTAVYVAHTPNAGFADVIRAALAAQRAGFLATPHIAVRRVPDRQALKTGLAQLRDGGVDHILLIAGDAPRPLGEFSCTLDVLESRILQESGIVQIGVAGHPEGHNAVDADRLWEALEAKQAWAARLGQRMHIVTQFGLDGGAFKRWERELMHRRIRLPVRLGIAGPAPLPKLAHFAIQCGIGASMRVLMRSLSAAGRSADVAVTPDQHLLAHLTTTASAQVVAPHFFAFGGALETARWMRKIAAGAFDIDAAARHFRLYD
ncbi:MAG: methylenetetrahydrofolate reductase [Steroidobacteraceae bacterium]